MRCETRAAERDPVPVAEPLSHRALCQAVSRRARLRHRFYSSAVGFFPGQAFTATSLRRGGPSSGCPFGLYLTLTAQSASGSR